MASKSPGVAVPEAQANAASNQKPLKQATIRGVVVPEAQQAALENSSYQ
jgi:hypothetical protein